MSYAGAGIQSVGLKAGRSVDHVTSAVVSEPNLFYRFEKPAK
jgi:hypothetical protein